MAYDLVDLTIEQFASSGRMLQAGVAVQVPELPRSRRLRMALEREAGRDPRVRKAYEVALARAERTKQVKPGRILRRDCGTILTVR
jgi:hypothetical protein